MGQCGRGSEGGIMKRCVRMALAEWLKENGFDGLCNPNIPCGCLIDDLAPCDEMGGGMDCFAGHRVELSPGVWGVVVAGEDLPSGAIFE